jgi:hypothetical protein
MVFFFVKKTFKSTFSTFRRNGQNEKTAGVSACRLSLCQLLCYYSVNSGMSSKWVGSVKYWVAVSCG